MQKNREKILQQLTKEIESYFSDKLEFAIIFGSWARLENKKNSDLDLMVVLKTRDTDFNKIKIFKEKFVFFQEQNGLIPDRKYPGEYISIFDIKKAIDGFGFVKNNNIIKINLISCNSWDSFNEYRQWLGALSGPNIFLTGNKKSYQKLQNASFNTSVLAAILNCNNDTFTTKDIIKKLLNGGKRYLGFCKTRSTRKYLSRQIPLVLKYLLEIGVVINSPNKNFNINRIEALKRLPNLLNENEINYKRNFLGFSTTEHEKNILKKCLELGMNFVLNDKEKVLNYYSENEIIKRFKDKIPIRGALLTEVVDEFKKKIMDGSVRQSSSRYLAFPDSGNAISALAADIISCFINQNLIATTKSAPTGTFAEIQVIQWLRELIGFPIIKNFPESALEVGGIVTTGGVLANTIALLVARCRVFPDSRIKGLQSIKIKPILIVASNTLHHYSHIAAFWWLGLGEENIVFIKTLADFRLDLNDLDKKLTKYNNDKHSKVVAVICQAGDSRTTTIEHFEKISEITKRHGVWLHVDACHGGILLFSEKHKHRMRGIEQANSVSIDPHKGLGVPYPLSLIIFKDETDCRVIGKSSDITIENNSFDLGQVTSFVGSRAFDSLKLWFLIKNLGVEGIGKLVDYRYDLACRWSDCIENSHFFISLNSIELNSVVFSVSPDKLSKWYPDIQFTRETIGNLNKLIHDDVYKEGYLCIHYFDLMDVAKKITSDGGKLKVLGVMFGNPNTLAMDFFDHITYLDKIVQRTIKLL